jgi:hypothetical protein
MSRITANFTRQYSNITSGSSGNIENENPQKMHLYEAQGVNPNESQSVTQCPFLEFIKPTLKEANPEVVQDIFEQKKAKA